jgi:hypothetical protein
VGMFRDMKDMMKTVRSDELKELKKKADAQPKVSMLDGVKMANQAYDQAMVMQQQAGQIQAQYGNMGDPTALSATAAGGLMGTATVNAINDTGMVMNNAPVCELDLTVTVPGREPYQVKHRQLIAQTALARFQPGSSFSVRVDQNDPTKLVIG